MPTIRSFSARTTREIGHVVRAFRRRDQQGDSRRRPVYVPTVFDWGKVTAASGSSVVSYRYSVVSKSNPAVTLTLQPVRNRDFPSGTDYDRAPLNSDVILGFENDQWYIVAALGEKVVTNTCHNVANAGVVGSGVTVATAGRGDYIKTTLTLAEYNTTVAAATNNQYGKLIFTFPTGYVKLLAAVLNLNYRASDVLLINAMEIGLGTATATGQSGAALTSTRQDQVLGDQVTSALTTSDQKYNRFMPDGSVSGDSANVADLYDGSSTAIPVYLNFCQTGASWAMGADVILSGTVTLWWFKAGGAI